MIKLTGVQVAMLYAGEPVEGYEGWTIDCDTSTGDVWMEKQAQHDFEVYLYEGDILRGTAIGGWYSNYEHFFEDQDDYEFEEPTSLDDFNKYLIEVANKALNASNEIAEMEAKLKLVADYITKIRLEQGTKEL